MRMIDADSLESKLPAHSNDSNHVMTRNFAVESFRALIKAEPTVTPPPVYARVSLSWRRARLTATLTAWSIRTVSLLAA